MAIQIAVNVGFMVVGDGTSTAFSFDLRTFPYEVGAQTVNWLAKLPTGALSAPGLYTAKVSGTILTVTFATPPKVNVGTEFAVILLF